MAKALKGLAITSTDFVDQGANPEAHIMLYKSAVGKKKDGNSLESQEYEEDKSGFQEDSSDLEGKYPHSGKKSDKSRESESSEETDEENSEEASSSKKELSLKKMDYFQGFPNETVISKEKMLSLEEENRSYAEKISGMASELASLKKTLRMKEMEEVASRFQVIGKRKEELAPVLFTMGEAGDEVFQNYVKSLEEQVDLMGKRDIFSELGSEIQGTVKKSSDLLGNMAQEICKRDSVTMAQAMVLAFEENPSLAREYEEEMGGL